MHKDGQKKKHGSFGWTTGGGRMVEKQLEEARGRRKSPTRSPRRIMDYTPNGERLKKELIDSCLELRQAYSLTDVGATMVMIIIAAKLITSLLLNSSLIKQKRTVIVAENSPSY